MSRIGRKPVVVDSGVKVEFADQTLTVSGPKGKITFPVPACVDVQVGDKQVNLQCATGTADAQARALHGLARSMLQNMIKGVTQGYRKDLEIQGVGYRGKCVGSRLCLSLGFSHAIEVMIPEGVKVTMPDNTHIVIEGVDKQMVGQTAATIRGIKPPDAYQGKGVRYVGEQVTLKEGKTVG
jgi:large subunit ribosomal protein L6